VFDHYFLIVFPDDHPWIVLLSFLRDERNSALRGPLRRGDSSAVFERCATNYVTLGGMGGSIIGAIMWTLLIGAVLLNFFI